MRALGKAECLSPPKHRGDKLNIDKIREDFPILKQRVHGKSLIYFDNAATSQKPKQVIDEIDYFYRNDNANIHRGVHRLSERATEEFEAAREKVREFLGAPKAQEIIFVRGATEAINLVAQTYGRQNFKENDEIIISTLEHHSNIVPWQMLCEQTGAKLKVIPINERGELIFEEFEKLLNPRTKFVAVGHVSNALGTINPIKEIIQKAHAQGAKVLIDGAQAAPHVKIDVQALDADFYAISGHKMYGPTGIGALYGKEALLQAMPPYQGGGDMIRTVSFEKSTYNDLPYKFEAGTPDIAGGIGLGAAVDYLNELGLDRIAKYEHELLEYATAAVEKIPGLTIIGQAREKAAVISFVMEGVHPHDIGTILDLKGIAIRTGHHCTMPLMQHLKLPATARASFAFYNTNREVDVFAKALRGIREVFHQK